MDSTTTKELQKRAGTNKLRQVGRFVQAPVRSDTESEPCQGQPGPRMLVHPEFRSFWMWQDRYLVTAMRTYEGYRYTISLYRDGELMTDGNLYGNDY